MIEISFGKLVLLALVALIVLGPEKLPGVARTAGALLRRVRSGWDNVRAEVEREFEIEEIKRTAREAAARAEALQSQLNDGVQKVREPLAGALDEAAAMVRPKAPATGDGAETGTEAGDDPSSQVQAELPLSAPAPAEPNRDHPA
ncbi:preprotein translocase subunit TatA [Rhodanobacter sp. Root627]|uniref:Sec-independent protein translocase protein TatB n=1 Tax=Rhodanobacter sp. Root627 TaxID=1736572 RepID=UPI0006FA4D11|nr:Sec-independent protein translocase protein TatB [Rhodanobacter sp. Root627]KRA33393.1 preprotein translocase subunit TatA [Rhodanobacter sp. Root627]